VAVAKIEVQVTQVQAQAMPVVLEGVGVVVAQASVEVRPQAGGVLRQVFIRDGDRVVAGQKLFALDAQPLAAALVQAQAQWARDKALADDAVAVQARLKPLAEKEYVTAREYETAVSNGVSLRAAAAASRTLIEQARITLAYATIAAPISGRAGAVLVKPGSLVAVSNTTPLVVINALSPIEVAFSLPQDMARRLRDALAAAHGKPLAVEARDSLTRKLRARGELVFIDNALNAQSGAIAVKARFANTDEALWPGEFYAMRITLKTEEAAITVSEGTLQQGQSGPYVYVVAAGVAKIRPITVDRVLDGVAVIASGLKAGETVLASVPAVLRDGSAVQVAAPPLSSGTAR
jgi:RND family efflux transporter MFP subunit